MQRSSLYVVSQDDVQSTDYTTVKTPGSSTAALQFTYLDHFSLNGKPFGTTADPDLFFESRGHSAAMQSLESYLRESKEGLALVYGDIGMGKTLISRRFFNGLPRNELNVALITDPLMDATELLSEIAGQFNVTPLPSPTHETGFGALRDFLSIQLQTGRASVLVIDEAQLLSNDALALLADLSSPDKEYAGRVHVVLFGQEEIATRLLDRSMARLRRHISVTHYLQPLSAQEVASYVKYRLSKTDSKGTISFTREALDCVYAASGGCPRVINRICDESLHLLSRRPGTTVDRGIVDRALKGNAESLLTGPEPFQSPARLFYAIALIVAALLIFFFPRLALG